MDLASVVAALASVGVRVSGSAPNSSVQVDSSRACPPGLAGPEPSGTIHDLGQHFHLHGCKPKLCFPFATRVEVQRIMETFLTPQSLKHTIYGKKCIYRRYWHVHIFGTLRSKNMSKHLRSRPIVGALKYAHYG